MVARLSALYYRGQIKLAKKPNKQNILPDIYGRLLQEIKNCFNRKQNYLKHYTSNVDQNGVSAQEITSTHALNYAAPEIDITIIAQTKPLF